MSSLPSDDHSLLWNKSKPEFPVPEQPLDFPVLHVNSLSLWDLCCVPWASKFPADIESLAI